MGHFEKGKWIECKDLKDYTNDELYDELVKNEYKFFKRDDGGHELYRLFGKHFSFDPANCEDNHQLERLSKIVYYIGQLNEIENVIGQRFI